MTTSEENSELFIANEHAHTHVDHDGGTDSGLRVYQDSPDTVCIQVRTFGPTNGKFGYRARGKARPAYSTVSLDSEALDRLIAELTKLRREVRP